MINKKIKNYIYVGLIVVSVLVVGVLLLNKNNKTYSKPNDVTKEILPNTRITEVTFRQYISIEASAYVQDGTIYYSYKYYDKNNKELEISSYNSNIVFNVEKKIDGRSKMQRVDIPVTSIEKNEDGVYEVKGEYKSDNGEIIRIMIPEKQLSNWINHKTLRAEEY